MTLAIAIGFFLAANLLLVIWFVASERCTNEYSLPLFDRGIMPVCCLIVGVISVFAIFGTVCSDSSAEHMEELGTERIENVAIVFNDKGGISTIIGEDGKISFSNANVQTEDVDEPYIVITKWRSAATYSIVKNTEVYIPEGIYGSGVNG